MIDSSLTRQTDEGDHSRTVSVMPAWSIWAGALALAVVAIGSMWLLLSLYGSGSPQDKIQLEIVRLAGSIVIGTGGAVGLLLAARRQRSTELSLAQTERDLVYKEQSAADIRHDAEERRISDLQASAGEQLGSDKAAVRLNGLYQLERLGQNYLDHRQTVVDVLCAYLRMPFTHPDDLPPAVTAEDGKHAREELQVRLTAQRILASHLLPGLHESSGAPTNEKFWSNIRLDLTGALLAEFDLSLCRVGECAFVGAHFRGAARFSGMRIEGGAFFSHARFDDTAWFTHAKFKGGTDFGAAVFSGTAWFSNACFESTASFSDVHFNDGVDFDSASFHDSVSFREALFEGAVQFSGAQVEVEPRLSGARCRWDRTRARREDAFPNGWTTMPPETEEVGHIEGRGGVWGYVVRDAQLDQESALEGS